MVDTPDADRLSALAAQSDAFRRALIRHGFSDDGTSLQGRVSWTDALGTVHDARIEVTLDERFPFAPPNVTILQAETGFIPSFHIERNGSLCLWTSDVPVDGAPWLDARRFLDRVSGWFSQTATGWPDDNDADLERYLEPSSGGLVLYDDSRLEHDQYYRTSRNGIGVVTIGEQLPWHPHASRISRRGTRRREQHLAWVVDVGPIARPIRTIQDLQDVTGQDLTNTKDLIKSGSLDFILVRYQRGSRRASLVLDFPDDQRDVPILTARESADNSLDTRTLRAGVAASAFADKKVVVVGCGAIGSQVAELLFRSGVSQLTLVDSERYRPGNVIRHTAHHSYAGAWKVRAVRERLSASGLNTDNVATEIDRVSEPTQAVVLVSSHDLVVDATADARTTALLRWAVDGGEGVKLVSVCVQRDGGIARVDRFPTRANERHLDPVPLRVMSDSVQYEQGCGSPVSMTPPASAARAAAVACHVVLDELSAVPTLPATILEVIVAQGEEPYNRVGTITS